MDCRVSRGSLSRKIGTVMALLVVCGLSSIAQVSTGGTLSLNAQLSAPAGTGTQSLCCKDVAALELIARKTRCANREAEDAPALGHNHGRREANRCRKETRHI